MARPTNPKAEAPDGDPAAESGDEVPDDGNIESYTGEDGSKSPGYLKYPPKPGLPGDADDAGRENTATSLDEYGRPIIMKDR